MGSLYPELSKGGDATQHWQEANGFDSLKVAKVLETILLTNCSGDKEVHTSSVFALKFMFLSNIWMKKLGKSLPQASKQKVGRYLCNERNCPS